MSMNMSYVLAKPSHHINVRAITFSYSSTSRSFLSFHSKTRLQNIQYGSGYVSRMAIRCSIEPPLPPPPLTPPPPSSPFPGLPGKGWIAGLVISILLPFLKNKWGPLFTFKTEVDKDIQMIEETVEVLEKVAERVEKVAEDVAEDLPEGRLKKVVTDVEEVAELVAETAHLTETAIDKVQELEDKVVSYVEKSQSDPAHEAVNKKHN